MQRFRRSAPTASMSSGSRRVRRRHERRRSARGQGSSLFPSLAKYGIVENVSRTFVLPARFDESPAASCGSGDEGEGYAVMNCDCTRKHAYWYWDPAETEMEKVATQPN